MKLCDIVQFYSPLGGGVRRYILDKAHYLSAHKNLEHAVIIPSDHYGIETVESSRFYHVKSIKLPGSLSYRALLNRERIFTAINDISPDILEVGDPYRSAWISLEAAHQRNIPIVAFYHSDFPRALGRTIHKYLGQGLENWLAPRVESYVVDLYNRMSATVVASHRLEKVLKETGINNVVRIPLGTDIEIFKPQNHTSGIRSDLKLNEKTKLLLFVGRLAREKNIRSLAGMIDTLNKNSSNKDDYHLLLVGDGEQWKYVEQLSATRPDVTWYKFCNAPADLARYYSAADAFVHAGCYETFGITSLEAQACGTPVLAVENGGLGDTLIGEEPLVMSKSARPEDLAQGVIQLLETNPRQRSQQRRERMEKHFSIQKTFERMTQLYAHLIDGQPATDFFINEPKQDDEHHYQALLTG